MPEQVSNDFSFRRKTVMLIIVLSIARLIVAGLLELGNDETYYWLFSRHLQWNYFDHPPMVALWIRIFTFNNAFDNHEVFVRLGSIVASGLSTWILFKTVETIATSRAAWFAACIFNASLYAGIMAGLLIMPDSPQLIFWTLSMLMLARISVDPNKKSDWIIFGISVGLAVMSKVHGVFLWFGFGLYILMYRRVWLRKPELYFGVLATVLIASPILLWNMKYDFVTWKFHSERIDLGETIAGKQSFLSELIQQILVNNPINVILLILALLSIARARKIIHPSLAIFNLIGIPFVVLVLFISLFRDIWYYWSGPAFISLIPLTAIYLDNKWKQRLFWPLGIRLSLSAFVLFLIIWPSLIFLFPGTYGVKQGPKLGEGDITLDKYGWDEAGELFAAFYAKDTRLNNNLTYEEKPPIICGSWWGAHVEYYFGKESNIPVVALGELNKIHHYAWTNAERIGSTMPSTAYAIATSIEPDNTIALYKSYYREIFPVDTIQLNRSGQPAIRFYIYKLSGWKNHKFAVPQYSF